MKLLVFAPIKNQLNSNLIALTCLLSHNALFTSHQFIAVIPIEAHRLKLQNTFTTPVYTTSMRRNAMGVGLVFQADLHTTEHISHWVLQGVCLTLNSD